MSDENDDPTCIHNILEEFRTNSQKYYRSSMLPINAFSEQNVRTSITKPRKLTFDQSIKTSQSEIPDKRKKFETPNEKDFITDVISPWEARRVKSELLKCRSQLIQAEERIANSEGLKIETELHYAREKKTLEEALNEERKKVNELESRLKFVRKREADAIEQYSQLKCLKNNTENPILKMLPQLQKENHDLKELLFESQNEVDNIMKKEDNYINFFKNELESFKNKDELNSRLIQDIRNELMEKNKDLRRLEMEQTKLLAATKRVKDLESERETYLETHAYIESQNKKLMQFSELEKEISEVKDENKRLKSSISNTLLLETVVEDLKNRLKTMDNLEKDIIELRTENQKHRTELENWSNLSKHYCINDDNSKPFILIQKRLEELVQKELWYVSENKNLEINVSHLKEKIDNLEKELSKSEEQVNCFKASCETHISNIRNLKRNWTLALWERNNLRDILDSCQKEMTMTPETHCIFDALQKAINEYREKTANIELNSSTVILGNSVRTSTSAGKKDELLKRESSLKEENQKLQEKIQSLTDQLEYRCLKRDFDPTQTKIIGLRLNPTSEAKQNYENRLTKANEIICKLQERIKVLEEGNNADVTRIVEERVQTNSVKELNELKERTKSLEIQNQRLVEVFKKRSHDFRDAIYMLFGYKVDFLHNNQYRLCSLYAYDPQDVLLFQVSQAGSGPMELLGTPFSQTLTELIDLHLKQHKSIPVFLASLTVDLFNKQTFSSLSTMESTVCITNYNV